MGLHSALLNKMQAVTCKQLHEMKKIRLNFLKRFKEHLELDKHTISQDLLCTLKHIQFKSLYL
jgi:hypothetical protein